MLQSRAGSPCVKPTSQPATGFSPQIGRRSAGLKAQFEVESLQEVFIVVLRWLQLEVFVQIPSGLSHGTFLLLLLLLLSPQQTSKLGWWLQGVNSTILPPVPKPSKCAAHTRVQSGVFCNAGVRWRTHALCEHLHTHPNKQTLPAAVAFF